MGKPNFSIAPDRILTAEERDRLTHFVTLLITIDTRLRKTSKRSKASKAKSELYHKSILELTLFFFLIALYLSYLNEQKSD